MIKAARKRNAGTATTDPTFTIAASAMDELATNMQSFVHICNIFDTRPLVALGWSASEPYMIQALSQVKDAGGLVPYATTPDALSIIDLVFNAEGHAQLAALYGVTPAQALVQVLKKGDYTCDDLFLWVQALYALEQLNKFAVSPVRPLIAAKLAGLRSRPQAGDFSAEWVDNFLPVWVRTCWRAGLVKCFHNGQVVPPNQVPCDRRDEHIPFHLPLIDRPDLKAVASLFAALLPDGKGWAAQSCPGLLWNARTGHLVVPVPAWSSDWPTTIILTGRRQLS